jgi:hypothetical protein
MTIFGFHFCQHELMMLTASLPFISIGISWLITKWNQFRGTECPHVDCTEGGGLDEYSLNIKDEGKTL